MTTTQTVIAIDGRPASPAMAAALAKIAANGAVGRARKARIDADHRIIARRAALAALHTDDSAAGVFTEMLDGTMQRRAILSRLVRVRIELIEGFPHHARRELQKIAADRIGPTLESNQPGLTGVIGRAKEAMAVCEVFSAIIERDKRIETARRLLHDVAVARRQHCVAVA